MQWNPVLGRLKSVQKRPVGMAINLPQEMDLGNGQKAYGSKVINRRVVNPDI